jgi:predicted Zn-dependent protease
VGFRTQLGAVEKIQIYNCAGNQTPNLENNSQRRLWHQVMTEAVQTYSVWYQYFEFSMINPRTMRWEVHIERMRDNTNAYKFLVENPERRRPYGRSKRRWKDNIKIDL